MRIIIINVFYLSTLVAGFLTPLVSVHAHRMDFELSVTHSNWVRKESLATTREPAIRLKLRADARNGAIAKLRGLCADLRGHLAYFGCERKVENSLTHRWGGRVGYEAYETEVSVSAICSSDDSNLNWAEEEWYSLLYPILESCPSPKVIAVGLP